MAYALLFVITLPAQAQPPSTRPADPDTQPTSVFLTESQEARQALENALALKKQGEIDQAVRACQGVLETYGDSLLKLGEDFYMPVSSKMETILRDRDPAWVRAYREAYSQQARAALERLGDHPTPQELLAIAQRWWLTPAGGEAAYRAGIRIHEAGQWLNAALILFDLTGVLRDYLEMDDMRGHPDGSQRADWLFAQAIVLGQDPSSPGLDSQFVRKPLKKAIDLDRLIWWRGHHMGVLDAWITLEQLASLDPLSLEHWPMWGGDASRSRVGVLGGEPLELLWTAETSSTWGAGRDWRAPGDGIGGHLSLPVTDGRRIFIQDANRIRALGLHHGLTLWEYAVASDAGDNAGRPMGASTRGPLAPVVHDGLVYAILGQERDNPFTQQREHWDSYLTCLRAEDGSVRWRISAEAFAQIVGRDRGAPPRTAWWWFDGGPLVHDGAVYTVIRRQQFFGFEDCYLARWDRLTGRCIWWSLVASGDVGRGAPAVMTRCAPSAWHGDLYMYTNLGAFACVSSMTGQVEWLRAVPLRHTETRPVQHLDVPNQTWTVHPLVVAYGADDQGRRKKWPEIYVAVDQRSRELVVIEFASRIRSRISPQTLGHPETVLGPLEGIVYAIGNDVVAFDLRSDQVVWRQTLLRDDESIDGMACLTDEAVWIPTDRALTWISLQGKGPQRWSWEELGLEGDAARQGGNLLALGDILLSVRRTHVAAWACGTRALPLLKKEMTEAPEDPQAQLGLARHHLLNAGDSSAGWQALQRAVELSEAMAFQPYGDVGRRQRLGRLIVELMNDAMAAIAEEPSVDVAAINARFELWSQDLSRLQVSPETRNSSWMAMARLMEQRQAWPEAVQLWQNVVEATSSEDEFIDRSQRRQALDAQTRILESQGRTPFTAYDRQARRLRETASVPDDAEVLETIVEDYRYASTAPATLLALADQLVRHGHTHRAHELYLLAWHRYGPDRQSHWPEADTRELLNSMVKSALESGDRDRAAYWCSVGRMLLPDVTIESKGRKATFEQWYKRLIAEGLPEEPKLPEPAPPIERRSALDLKPGSDVLFPEIQAGSPWDSERPAFWLIANDGQWQAYDPSSGSVLWQRTDDEALPPQRLLLFEHLAVVTSPYRWLALDRHDGAQRWTWGKTPATWNDPKVDPEIWRRLVDTASNDLWICGAWDDGAMELIRIRDGRRLWRRDATRLFRRPLAMGELFIAHASRENDRTAIVVLDLFTGREQCTIQRPDDRLIHGMFFTTQGGLLAHGSDWLACYDPRTADPIWSRPLEPGQRIARLDRDGPRCYLMTQSGTIQSRNVATGQLQWTHAPESVDGNVSALIPGKNHLYVIRAKAIGVLDIATGKRRARLKPPPSCAIQEAWLTRQGLAALLRFDGRPGTPVPPPTRWTLGLWPQQPEDSQISGIQEGPLQTSVELGDFARVHAAQWADGRFILHADNTLTTWSTKKSP